MLYNFAFKLEADPNNYVLTSNQGLKYDENNNPDLASRWFQVGDVDAWVEHEDVFDDGRVSNYVQVLDDAAQMNEPCTVVNEDPEVLGCTYPVQFPDPDYQPEPGYENETLLVRQIVLNDGTPVTLVGYGYPPGTLAVLSSTFVEMPVAEVAGTYPSDVH